MRLKKYLKEFFKSNIIKTIEFNFKMLPFKDAIKMPVFLYGKVTFRSLEGSIEFSSPLPIYPGMVKFGVKEWYVTTSVPQLLFNINGTIRFKGPIRFLQGAYITVARRALLEFGTNGTVGGTELKIMCFENIKIGDQVGLTWNVQLYDTSFHYIEYIDSSKPIEKLTKPIVIGDRVWVGNNTTISKGAIIPNDTIIASNSLVNKDFSHISPYSMLAGMPAKLKAEGIKRIRDNRFQKELDKSFGYDRTHL